MGGLVHQPGHSSMGLISEYDPFIREWVYSALGCIMYNVVCSVYLGPYVFLESSVCLLFCVFLLGNH